MKVSGDKIIGIELEDTQSRGGLYLPAKLKPTADRTETKRMRVVKLGPGQLLVPDNGCGEARRVTIPEQLGHDLKEGDICVTTRYTYEYVLRGQKVRLFQASDILFVEEPGDAEPHQAS